MKTNNLKIYNSKFYSHIDSFINTYFPFNLSQPSNSYKIAVGVSAGPDSIALLYICDYLRQKYKTIQFFMLHFNHQSRPIENQNEEVFVEMLCHSLQFEFISKKNKNLTSQTEHDWRNQRHSFFNKFVERYQCKSLWLAHHIDDSYEWSCMQKSKSGHLIGTIGIPVVNGKIFRPFMCITKNQILKFLRINNIKYMNDSSNSLDKYERNWWRHHIIKKLKAKYPKLLPHYVQSANELALKFNLIYKQTPPGKKMIIDRYHHLYIFEKNQRVQDSIYLIRESLHNLSSKKRMKLRQQLRCMIQAFQNKKIGPIHFTGGVKVYTYKKSILITNREYFNNDNVIDLIEKNIQL